MSEPLFPDLSQQLKPAIRVMGNRALIPCGKCKGTGRERYQFYSGNYHAERGTRDCSKCKGAGHFLRSVKKGDRP